MTKGFLPYGRQTIEEDDIAAVAAVLRSDFLTTGPTVERFETALAERVDARHAVTCANGTAALFMAARALKLGTGSKVVVPAITFLATASAPHLAGSEIVFADVDPMSGLMRPSDLEDAIHRAGGADAVFNVHLTGQCGEVEEISAIARSRGLKIVDDACHAIGSEYRTDEGRHRIGSNAHCDLTVFSFHAVKTVTMGEGGAVTTNDDGLAHDLRLARNHGMTRSADEFVRAADAFAPDGTVNPWYYELIAPQFNFRVTDIQCALGLSQIAKLDRFADRRRKLAAAYDKLLAPLAPRIVPVARNAECRPAWHLYVVLIDFAAFGKSRAAVMHELAERGIGTQVHYFPVNRQPYYAARYGGAPLPGAERYYARALSLPLFPAMTEDDVGRVGEALRDVLCP